MNFSTSTLIFFTFIDDPSVNLIIGFPGETRNLVMETVELVKCIKGYDTITVSIFTPYRGTVLQKIAVKISYETIK